jgi:hypothetical protein
MRPKPLLGLFVFVCLLGSSLGCDSHQRVADMRNLSGATSGIESQLTPSSERSFLITVENHQTQPIAVCLYHFGYRLTVHYRDGLVRSLNLGDDMVPISKAIDWHALRQGQSVSWHVFLPTGWPSLASAKSASCEDSMQHVVMPKHISTDSEGVVRYRLEALWSGG